MALGQIALKRGSTLRLQLTFNEDTGGRSDLTNVELKSQVRTPSGDLVTTLPIIRTDAEGVATVEVVDTTGWPVGLLRMDIRAIINGVPVISETIGIQVGGAFTA